MKTVPSAWNVVSTLSISLTIDADDADNLQDLLSTAVTVYYDVGRRTLMFGATKAGHQ